MRHLFYFIEMNKFIWIGDKYYCFISTRYRTQTYISHFENYRYCVMWMKNIWQTDGWCCLIAWFTVLVTFKRFSYVVVADTLTRSPFNVPSLAHSLRSNSFYFYFWNVSDMNYFACMLARCRYGECFGIETFVGIRNTFVDALRYDK